MTKRFQRIADSLINLGHYLSLDGTENEISEPKTVSHSKWLGYLTHEFNREGMRILDVGGRGATSAGFRYHFGKAKYVAFDIHKGANVDIVGDAHRLSSYFKEEQKFDLIFSTAVFEHLQMPWVVAQEIQKLLKVGGHVFVETHFSFSSHERPCHFFQFSDLGLRVLFSAALGFELIDSGMSNPIRGYFSGQADKYLRYRPVNELYCHSEILCRKIRDVVEFDWRKSNSDDIADGARYPLPRE
jgi:hypothetical protein